MLPAEFHFLRPLWLLALFPAGLLGLALWAARLRGSGWQRAIDPALLPHLLSETPGGRQRWPRGLLLIAWLVATLSLAGPAWRKLPQPVRQKEDGLVLIQDLSLSLYAQDLAPNRLTRARHKLLDILQARREGLTALVVYSGDAHVVCPLTDDTATIAALVPELEPGIMPVYGSDPAAAVEQALRLCRDAGLNRGRLLLLTDEVEPAAAAAISKLLGNGAFSLAVLGVGTAAGGPIPLAEGGYLQDERGNIVIARLDGAPLAALATANGGRYREIRIDDGDFTALLGSGPLLPDETEYRQVEREFDQWREEGPWLLLLLLPLALLAFRRGWLLSALLLALLWPPRPSQALEWRDLWLRPDQQAARALAAGDPARAAALFRNPEWQGTAAYRAGDFAGAVAGFGLGASGDAHYNRGNSLARLGRYQEALQAYDQALRVDPSLADARANRQLVEKLLRQPQPHGSAPQSGQRQMQSGQSPPPSGPGQGQPPSGGEGESSAAGGQQESGQAGAQGQNRQAGAAGRPAASGAPGNQAGSEPGQAAPVQPGTGQDGAAPGEPAGEARHPSGRLGKPAPAGSSGPGTAAADADRLSPEQQQELAQRLRQVADNPGGLMRRKFEYQYRSNRQRGVGESGKIW